MAFIAPWRAPETFRAKAPLGHEVWSEIENLYPRLHR